MSCLRFSMGSIRGHSLPERKRIFYLSNKSVRLFYPTIQPSDRSTQPLKILVFKNAFLLVVARNAAGNSKQINVTASHSFGTVLKGRSCQKRQERWRYMCGRKPSAATEVDNTPKLIPTRRECWALIPKKLRR